MESQKLRNGFLFVIALCLVLIVLRLYSIDLVTTASAAPVATSNYSMVYGCRAGAADCRDMANWVPVRVTPNGALYTTN
jgi:hypothetical protein